MDNQDLLLIICMTALVCIYMNNKQGEHFTQESLDELGESDIQDTKQEQDQKQNEYEIEHFDATENASENFNTADNVSEDQPEPEPVSEHFVDGSGTFDSVAFDGLKAADLFPSDSSPSWIGSCPEPAQNLDYAAAMCNVGLLGTTAQSNRNPNLQLRAEVPNPQIPVSPWNMSTITAGNGQGLKVESC